MACLWGGTMCRADGVVMGGRGPERPERNPEAVEGRILRFIHHVISSTNLQCAERAVLSRSMVLSLDVNCLYN